MLPGIFGPSGPSLGRGEVFVNGGEGLTAGTYSVTVTFTGADTDEATEGNGTARGFVSSEATFSNGGENFAVIGSRTAELPDDPATVVLQYEVDLPIDAGMTVNATLSSDAQANGEGNSATTESIVQATTIEIERTSAPDPTDPAATTTQPTEPPTTPSPVTTLPAPADSTSPSEPATTEPATTEPPTATNPGTCVLGICV